MFDLFKYLPLINRSSRIQNWREKQYQFDTFKRNIFSEITDGGNSFDFKPSAAFIDWFVKNGTFFSRKYDTIPFALKPEEGQPGNCFHNSQRISLRYPNFGYWEGIVRGRKNKESIHHGFNVDKNRVLDVSLLTSKLEFEQSLKDLDFFYFGILIPDELYKSDEKIGNNRFYDNPLLVKYFSSTLNK